MNKTKGTYLALLAILLSSMAANADPIVYAPDGTGSNQVNSFEPLGQSFTAEDTLVEAGLFLIPYNPQFPNSDSVLYQLFAGLGTGGSLLANSQFSLATEFRGFYLVDFSSVSLTIGNTYSLVASIVGDSPYWGMLRTSEGPEGTGVLYGEPSTSLFALSVYPVEPEPDPEPDPEPAPVPEPGTLALFGLGLAGIGVSRRRKR